MGLPPPVQSISNRNCFVAHACTSAWTFILVNMRACRGQEIIPWIRSTGKDGNRERSVTIKRKETVFSTETFLSSPRLRDCCGRGGRKNVRDQGRGRTALQYCLPNTKWPRHSWPRPHGGWRNLHKTYVMEGEKVMHQNRRKTNWKEGIQKNGGEFGREKREGRGRGLW